MAWHDDPVPLFLSNLIGDLRDEVWRLKGQGNVARPEDQCAVLEDAATRDAMILSLQDQLREKKVEIDVVKAKYKNVVLFFLVFVVGLVAGKILLQ